MSSELFPDSPILLLRDAAGSLQASPGETVLLTGEVGSGKTAWLKRLAGVAKLPSHIDLSIDGKAPENTPESIRMLFDRHPQLWLGQTVREELCFGLKKPPPENLVTETLSDWGLGELAPDASLLSLNRLQAVGLALAAIALARPKIALLDNPTDALPQSAAESLSRQIATWAKRTETTVVVACNRWHDWQPVASQTWHVTSADSLPLPGGQT